MGVEKQGLEWDDVKDIADIIDEHQKLQRRNQNLETYVNISHQRGMAKRKETANKRKGRQPHFTKIHLNKKNDVFGALTMTERGYFLSLLYCIGFGKDKDDKDIDNYIVTKDKQKANIEEIAKMIGAGLTQTKTMLKKLEECGFLVRENAGKCTVVRICEEYAMRKEWAGKPAMAEEA